MAGSHTLRRLARVQQLEEEQAQTALEQSASELWRLEQLWRLVLERERAGRQLILAGVRSGEKTDWLAGQEEVRIARSVGATLRLRIAEAETELAERREVFVARRIKRQQTETLIAAAETRAAAEEARRAQQATDEWYLDRRRTAQVEEKSRTGSTGQDSAAAWKS